MRQLRISQSPLNIHHHKDAGGDTGFTAAILLHFSAIQRDLDRLERWPHAIIVKFNQAKYKVLHLGHGNPRHKCRLGRGWIESSPEEDLEVLLEEKLNMSWQRVLVFQKAPRILGCIPSSVASRAMGGILPLCSVLGRPHLESCLQLWGHQHQKDMDLLEWGQRRP
ncbi:hypothetical protein llap_14637 [Limosa lapponica baueri]|uniref:Rna-directed dna polymerase from mobile element jockey-like n=1 Tax=Limosa lapponica baueri TaxID=1758121 RepID=A0A2I0TMM9_LIMLA|nr:hypothetical protein llap_14637 [Limosa lapponica baueri]